MPVGAWHCICNSQCQGSWKIACECCNREHTYTHCALQHSVVSFCELVWAISLRLSCCCSWTFPLHNNSPFDRGKSSRAEIWQTYWKDGLLWQGHIESLWTLSILWLYVYIYVPVSNGCGSFKYAPWGIYCLNLLIHFFPLTTVALYAHSKTRKLIVKLRALIYHYRYSFHICVILEKKEKKTL